MDEEKILDDLANQLPAKNATIIAQNLMTGHISTEPASKLTKINIAKPFQ